MSYLSILFWERTTSHPPLYTTLDGPTLFIIFILQILKHILNLIFVDGYLLFLYVAEKEPFLRLNSLTVVSKGGWVGQGSCPRQKDDWSQAGWVVLKQGWVSLKFHVDGRVILSPSVVWWALNTMSDGRLGKPLLLECSEQASVYGG